MTEEEAKKFKLTFGKYKGSAISEIIDDEEYIDWLLKNTKDNKILECIKILTGKEKIPDEEHQEFQKLLIELDDLIMKSGTDRDVL